MVQGTCGHSVLRCSQTQNSARVPADRSEVPLAIRASSAGVSEVGCPPNASMSPQPRSSAYMMTMLGRVPCSGPTFRGGCRFVSPLSPPLPHWHGTAPKTPPALLISRARATSTAKATALLGMLTSTRHERGCMQVGAVGTLHQPTSTNAADQQQHSLCAALGMDRVGQFYKFWFGARCWRFDGQMARASVREEQALQRRVC